MRNFFFYLLFVVMEILTYIESFPPGWCWWQKAESSLAAQWRSHSVCVCVCVEGRERWKHSADSQWEDDIYFHYAASSHQLGCSVHPWWKFREARSRLPWRRGCTAAEPSAIGGGCAACIFQTSTPGGSWLFFEWLFTAYCKAERVAQIPMSLRSARICACYRRGW